MITGFCLRLTSAELQKHCSGRANYHAQREREYAKELPKVKESVEQLKKAGSSSPTVSYMSKGGSYDVDIVKDMEEKIRDHHNKSLVFEFFASHLFEEDYNLQENDLIRLEILKR